MMAQEMVIDGKLIESLEQGYQDYRKQYPDFTQWLALEVPVESLKGKQKRINITLSEPLLARVDAYVGFHKEYKDRSDFF